MTRSDDAPGRAGSHERAVHRIDAEGIQQRRDDVVVESPLEVRVIHPGIAGGAPTCVARLMRTPGHDVALALGFLRTQNTIHSLQDVDRWESSSIRHRGQTMEIITVVLNRSIDLTWRDTGGMITTASGGLSSQHLSADPTSRSAPAFRTTSTALFQLGTRLTAHQRLFQSTGSAHAAAFFDPAGALRIVREDVGRHNAVDKICGAWLLDGNGSADLLGLLLSGRVSFDLIAKAIALDVSFVAAIGAPTQQAVALAERHDIGLVGFLRSDQMNVYCGRHRIAFSPVSR